MLSTQLRPARSIISLYGWMVAAKGDHLSRLASVLTQVLRFTILAALLLAGSGPSLGAGKRSGRAARVQTGLDVLAAQKFAPLRGKHVGLITNHTGLDSQGRSTMDLLAHAPSVQIVALFSPEHGLAGRRDERVPSSKDPSTGLPVYSLYGETIEGPMLDADKTNFVAYFPLPVRYALTIGELAQFFNAENHIGADLHVISMRNWHRNYFFESTGIKWIPPSPNLRTIKGSILYPGIEILQSAGVSVGRGTQAPFEEFGAPWMNGDEVAAALNARNLPGLHFTGQPFIPIAGLYSGQRCGGVSIKITDRFKVRSMRIGLEIAAILQKLYPKQFEVSKLIELVGNADTVQQLQSGVPPEKMVQSWSDALTAFDKVRRKYFLYK